MFMVKLTEKSSLSKITDLMYKSYNKIMLSYDFIYNVRGDE